MCSVKAEAPGWMHDETKHSGAGRDLGGDSGLLPPDVTGEETCNILSILGWSPVPGVTKLLSVTVSHGSHWPFRPLTPQITTQGSAWCPVGKMLSSPGKLRPSENPPGALGSSELPRRGRTARPSVVASYPAALSKGTDLPSLPTGPASPKGQGPLWAERRGPVTKVSPRSPS